METGLSRLPGDSRKDFPDTHAHTKTHTHTNKSQFHGPFIPGEINGVVKEDVNLNANNGSFSLQHGKQSQVRGNGRNEKE